jgi:hypothetical protein
MLKEFNNLIDYKTFEYQEFIDTTKKLVLLMWVYANKFDENGCLTNFKARLITRGDLYKTEEETYATTLAP